MNPSEQSSTRSFDKLLAHPLMLGAAFAWGLSEAIWFFIVPDVLLTVIACRSLRAGSFAAVAALAGALVGGALMYRAGSLDDPGAKVWLMRVPGIHQPLIDRVHSQVSEHGAFALLRGPTLGIPYKIYAVEYGSRSTGLQPFLLLSVPARGIRFAFSVLVAAGLARLLARWTKRRRVIEFTVLAEVWVAFYVFYFVHFGW